MQTTYIFGHKVPDTDSVCASIALSYLKNRLGYKCEPRVLGDINKETKFVLDYFGFKVPEFLDDVRVQIKNMSYHKGVMVDEYESIYSAYKHIMDMGVTGLPLVNTNKKLTGYVNVKEISKYLIEGDINHLRTSYYNILNTLEGEEIVRVDEEIEGKILAAAYKSETFLSRVQLTRDNILIVSDRIQIQEYAINSGIKLMVVVNKAPIPDYLIEEARKKNVNIIRTAYGVYKTANMIKLCNYIGVVNVITDPVSFTPNDYRSDFIEISSKTAHTNYPIVNKKGVCLGMLKLIDANNFERKQVILVDHNQPSQSVDGLEEADILEVIDHHNLGTLGTNIPISFRSMPVGSTCTILYRLFREAHEVIPANIAGIMLASILSDTLLFKSPTTTDLDREVGEKLAGIAGIGIEEFGFKMFKAASSVSGLSVDDIIHYDMKTFKFDNSNLAIGQVLTLDFDEIQRRSAELIKGLNNMCEYGNYKVAILFITDIIKNGSYVFYNEGSRSLLEEAYGIDNINQGMYMEGVVSRKKQMLPPLLELDERR
jgi:manganese-dependent inorganic pyrophosphatase